MTHHATKTLQELGYRLTPQRTLVWDELRASGGHLSAEAICRRVQSHFPQINISTIYRTLELLVGLGLVRETHLGPDRRYFEVEEEEPHHHLICERCGAIEHLHNEDIQGLQAELAFHDFHLREANLFGTCGHCAQEEAPDELIQA
ncbi:MAG: transcriptional repressor [Thermoleophilia bacterium]